MTQSPILPGKILVAIASYGKGNDRYLAQLVREYRSMPFDIDLVVVSNLAKEVGPGVEVVVGVPDKDPWSLPFAHKAIFANRVNDYDLFIYSEDDILITENNIRAFLELTSVLPEDEVAGFLRIEKGPDGRIYYPEVHHRFHWDPASVRSRGRYTCACFSNEHAACYLLTCSQLQRAIASGGFLVAPHQNQYDLLCTAATDPYTQCGFRKVVCISQLDKFVVHHLPNKYLDRMGTEASEVEQQVSALQRIARNGVRPGALLDSGEVPLALPFSTYYSKSYYEPVQTNLVSFIPEKVRSVLSVGCGWGATEQFLIERGIRVLAVPIDPVISACAEARDVETVIGDLDTVRDKLRGNRFDCVVLSNVLHLVENPADILAACNEFAADDAHVIASVPNLQNGSWLWRWMRSGRSVSDLASYEKSGMHFTTHRLIREWFRNASLKVDQIADILPERARLANALTFGWLSSLFSQQLIAVARPMPRAALAGNLLHDLEDSRVPV